MTLSTLNYKMKGWKEKGMFPYESELPDSLIFPEDFWKKVIEIYKLTRNDGKERARSIFWVDGEVVVTKVDKGNEKAVTSRGKVSVKYSQSRRREYAIKEVFVDGKRYSKREVYYKKIPKKISVVYLFNMHTHPPHEVGEITNYSFFSLQDLKSMLSTNAIITGMIGNKLWILIRTNQTPKVLNNFEESEITKESLTKRLHIGVYSGEFKSKLRKHLLNNNTTT